MKFEVEIDDKLVEALAAAVADKLGEDAGTREAFAKFALEQILGWMSGRTTYQSMTEQHTEWLTALLPVFYPDEAPSPERIFNNFSVPYGRAAYISRVLLEKQQTIWRKKGRDTLFVALKAKDAEATANNNKADGRKLVPVSLDNASYRELTVIVEDLFSADATLPSPANKGSAAGRRNIDIPSQLFPLILAKFGA
ncbi:hypothetical protein [Neorhizobium galegae]|uniref:hypothetical protein n=1 Tax=Neorhizobium galegae TaxID=399 RepID=UPI0006220C03|nr:hypothetical protein [Neorhizobium galegae]KAB1125557.1 hypothetical protein F4V90_00030 [Neorhizobium galegae]MCQ1805814.1 hypothetical protein [Neorhizobium galegae]CDZ59632.1 Hypothetical protein NGAL_HAMBI2566_36050 [Neorhizobium galegae bv. orientalis]